MNQPKTAKDLIAILAQERNACVKGKAVVLGADDYALREVIKLELNQEFAQDPMYQFVGLEGFEQMWAYHDFRDLIHKYQIKHEISGVTWNSIMLGDREVTFPEIDSQLVCLETDMLVLQHAKPLVIKAWAQYTQEKDLHFWYEDHYNPTKKSSTYVDVNREHILKVAHDCEWANLRMHKSEPDVILEVGWGDPNKAGYFDYADSDNFFFNAAPPSYWKPSEDYVFNWGCPIRS